jgi:ubiquinone biosynthesis protein
MADMPPKIAGIPALGAIGFSLSAIIGLVIVISIYRNKEE